MAAANTLSVVARIHAALNKPVYQRCADVTKILEEYSLKELHSVLPLLLDSIFGFNNQLGWGLGRLTRHHAYDFQALRQLLSPDGTLIRLVHKLFGDPYFRYEFPLSCLPLGSWSNASEGLYAVLLEDYLNYFLPPDGRAAPPMPHSPQPVRSPLHHASPGHRQSPSNLGRWSPMSNRLHSSGLGAGLLRYTTPNQPMPQVTLPALEQDTWRSHTFMQILVEFWLNQSSLDSEQMTPKAKIMESFLPSADHVRVVRMLVKHIHYFVNSGNTPPLSSWDHLRRIVLPQMFQKKMYAFLKHAFERWPLDSSFRLVLETWLSFIQPWRYTSETLRTQERDHESREKIVDNKWLGFVVENLLFYSQLFQDFLPRAFRMDLVAPKNAYMLFRVTKVFSVPNLKALLEEAESIFYEGVSHHSPLASLDLGGSFLGPAATHASHAAALNLQMTELEGPGYQYSPLFCENTKVMLCELLRVLTAAKVSALNSKQMSESNDSSLWAWLGFGSGIDYNTTCIYPDSYDDYGGGGDSRKLEAHLDQARDNICKVFEVQVPLSGSRNVMWGGTNQDVPENLAPDTIQTEDGLKLTPLGRYQLMNGLRKFDIESQIDPDLRPISSFECAFLARILYQFCCVINDRFRVEMAEIYHHGGFKGCFFRQFLHGPHSAYVSQVRKPMPVSPKSRQWEQRPRISLRWLAKYETLGYFGAVFLLLNMWCGVSFPGYLLLLLIGTILYGFLGALLKSVQSRRFSTSANTPYSTPYRNSLNQDDTRQEFHTPGTDVPIMSWQEFFRKAAVTPHDI